MAIVRYIHFGIDSFLNIILLLVSHLSIPQYSTSNRLAEQAAEYKRRYGSLSKVPRRLSSQVRFGNYDDKHLGIFDDEPRLRANSFNARNTKF